LGLCEKHFSAGSREGAKRMNYMMYDMVCFQARKVVKPIEPFAA